MGIFQVLTPYLYYIFVFSSLAYVAKIFISDAKKSRVLYSEGKDDLRLIKQHMKDMKFVMYKKKNNEKIWDLSQTAPKTIMTWLGPRPIWRIDRDSSVPLAFVQNKNGKNEKLNPEFMASMMSTKIFKDILSVSSMKDDMTIWLIVGAGGVMLGYIIQPIISQGLV